MSKETPRYCETCNKSEIRTDKPCPDRKECFTPLYKQWEPIGEVDPPGTGCGTCSHWAAVKIGTYCPDCARPIIWT